VFHDWQTMTWFPPWSNHVPSVPTKGKRALKVVGVARPAKSTSTCNNSHAVMARFVQPALLQLPACGVLVHFVPKCMLSCCICDCKLEYSANAMLFHQFRRIVWINAQMITRLHPIKVDENLCCCCCRCRWYCKIDMQYRSIGEMLGRGCRFCLWRL